MLAAGAGLESDQGSVLATGLSKVLSGQAKVLWLQGQSCTGCSISFLNTEEPGPLEVLTEVISLIYHSNISAAQGQDVIDVLDKAEREGGYLLVLEGALPLGMPEACVLGGKPLTERMPGLLKNAAGIVAAGTCAAFGGIPAGEGNVTGAASLRDFMQKKGIPFEGRLINCPGCPVHPQSLLGTVAHVLAAGIPQLDPDLLTPDMFYKQSVHDACPRFHNWERRRFAAKFGDEGCLFKLGCLGPLSHTSCPKRQWNSSVNWCIGAGAPCTACTSPIFASKRDFPFYRKGEQVHGVAYLERDREGAKS